MNHPAENERELLRERKRKGIIIYVLLRHNESIYGVQISPVLMQGKHEFTVLSGYVRMGSPLHVTACSMLSSEAGTKCFASVLPL